jgi:hypothetical protein
MEETAEATINPDGSSSYQANVPTNDQTVQPPVAEPLNSDLPPTIEPAFEDGGGGAPGDGGGGGDSIPNFEDEIPNMADKPPGGIDPAIYLIVAFLVAIGIYWFFFLRKKDDDEGDDDFFASTSNDKVRTEGKLSKSRNDRCHIVTHMAPPGYFLLHLFALVTKVREASEAPERSRGVLQDAGQGRGDGVEASGRPPAPGGGAQPSAPAQDHRVGPHEAGDGRH